MLNRYSIALLIGMFAPGSAAAQLAVMGANVQEQVSPPGGSYTGTILIRNTSSEPQAARIYQTDYQFKADGSSAFDAPGSRPRSNAQWVATSGSQVTVPPGATVPVQYTVTVPADASLSGTYWSVIMVEGIQAGVLPTVPAARRTLGLVPVIRYAVQVVSHIEQSGQRQIQFVNTRVVADADGRRTLEFEIHNTGERAYRLDVKAELFDTSGALVGTLQQTRGLIFPGSSVLQRFDISSFPPQDYQALILADTGEEDVFGAQYTLRM